MPHVPHFVAEMFSAKPLAAMVGLEWVYVIKVGRKLISPKTFGSADVSNHTMTIQDIMERVGWRTMNQGLWRIVLPAKVLQPPVLIS